MTFDEYLRERKTKRKEQKILKYFFTIGCIVILISSITANKAESVGFLNTLIWILCAYCFELKKEKDNLYIEKISKSITETDGKIFVALEEKLKNDPFI